MSMFEPYTDSLEKFYLLIRSDVSIKVLTLARLPTLVTLTFNNRSIVTIFILVSLILSLDACIAPVLSIRNQSTDAQAPIVAHTKSNLVFGAWVPAQFPLEGMNEDKQESAIYSLLEQGFNEYYFVMKDFTDTIEVSATEQLLESADDTTLKIFVILLPPSEGGSVVNYDWKGWISYFNSLKESHPSFSGFVMDDFNVLDEIRRVYLLNTMDRMDLSKFTDALSLKRRDVQFYPVMYLENGEFETLKKNYDKYMTGLILVSSLYKNITYLESDLARFSEMFSDKPLKYIVYITKTLADVPSDRLVMATLSVVSRLVEGIIIYVDTNYYIVGDFIDNYRNWKYISSIFEMEQLQIDDELEQLRSYEEFG